MLDLGTCKLLGYAMAWHMRAELVVDAITMAATQNDLAGGAIFHSDRGPPRTPRRSSATPSPPWTCGPPWDESDQLVVRL